jgi:adenosylmethionine-8-amino-7-oxononanoate aminotransferase
MREWLKREPIVIASGQGAALRDVGGRKYLDANSSIWTNLHGHNHPKINAAISRQLKKIAHSSALGFANEPASMLAEKLVLASNPKSKTKSSKLNKVFFSDDGSTAVEVAIKLAYEFTRRARGGKSQATFLSLDGAYHGDTVGAVSAGHIDLFHKAYSGLLFKTDKVMSPYCYRCPFNRAKPERADAREYRKCNWECVELVQKKFTAQKRKGNPYAAFIFEPLLQGSAGMIPQPKTWLKQVSDIARSHGALLIADEVMTGFGRTGKTFACQQENVQPDFLCLAKGMTGGYLPMAATLTTQKVFGAFLGKYSEFKTFFHGHSFTGNQLGASAALASLEILQSDDSFHNRQTLESILRDELKPLWQLPNAGDIRQVGLVAGIELVKNWRTREPFHLHERAGIRVCEAMIKHGVLTRPIGNVIVLMPPYCTTPAQMRKITSALLESIREIFGA